MTLHDVDDEEIDHYLACNDPDILGNLINFQYASMKTVRNLLAIWHQKARTLFELKLEHLTLDFSDAYAPDGGFLGLRFARGAPRFTYGIPQDLKIIAPSQTLAKGIDSVIRARNRGIDD